jgi:hypothetical protein
MVALEVLVMEVLVAIPRRLLKTECPLGQSFILFGCRRQRLRWVDA